MTGAKCHWIMEIKLSFWNILRQTDGEKLECQSILLKQSLASEWRREGKTMDALGGKDSEDVLSRRAKQQTQLLPPLGPLRKNWELWTPASAPLKLLLLQLHLLLHLQEPARPLPSLPKNAVSEGGASWGRYVSAWSQNRSQLGNTNYPPEKPKPLISVWFLPQ